MEEIDQVSEQNFYRGRAGSRDESSLLKPGISKLEMMSRVHLQIEQLKKYSYGYNTSGGRHFS
jgi:hypothetical protein